MEDIMYYELTGKTGFTLDGKCPICNSPAHKHHLAHSAFQIMAVCRICGKFLYESRAELFLNGSRDGCDNRLYKISHILRTVSDGAKGIRENSLFPVYSLGNL